MSLRLLPFMDMDAANEVILHLHEHHDPLDRPQKFAVGVVDEGGGLHGVAIVGTPVARELDDDYTFEIRRVATDRSKNVASMLYGSCLRTLAAQGARRALTYILASESGVSLRAAGMWLASPSLEPVAERVDLSLERQRKLATVRARHWGCKSRPRPHEMDLFGERPRAALVEQEQKLRYAIRLDGTRRRRR